MTIPSALAATDAASDNSFAHRLAILRRRIADAAAGAGRDDPITLVAVSKTMPAEAVDEAVRAGQRCFGENRVQEAAGKFPSLLAANGELELHLVGGLQTNKARDAVRLAHVIESLDRDRLATAIAQAAEQEGRLPRLLVQVNVGDEPQKSGVARAEADHFVERCSRRFGASLAGLMCVPPASDDPRPHFDWLRACARRHGLAHLSMGMSGDFEIAIAHGATHVRVGSALFGPRPVSPESGLPPA